MRLLLLFFACAGTACATSDGHADPCAAVHQAAERHVEAARHRGLSDAELAQHRQALRGALVAELSPDCRATPSSAPTPPDLTAPDWSAP